MTDDGSRATEVVAEQDTDQLRVRHGPDRHPIEPPPHGHPDPAGTTQVPRLASGLELVGEYEGSGFKDSPFIVRRGDGQMIQLPEPLFRLAELIDGKRALPEIAEQLTEVLQRSLSAEDVGYLVDEKLVPLGIIAARDGSAPDVQRADPLLALKFKTALVPDGFVRALTLFFKPLFFPPVIIAALVGLAVFDVWLFGSHGVAQPMRQLLLQPEMLLLALGLVVLSAMFHEIGHATGCAYGGAKPGRMGVGLYIVWPAFYTDVTDAYRLGRAGRLRTDLGGIYFNALSALAIGGAYFATGQEALLVVVAFIHVEILHQLLPFIRLDGYYIVADLTGVPDMFSRIKPVLVSMLPWKRADERVKELKPWARAIVTLWVLTIVPLLLFILTQILIHMPRIFATAAESLSIRWDATNQAFGRGQVAAGLLGVFQMVLLTLPLIGLPLTLGKLGRRVGSSAWRGTQERPIARALLVGTGLATLLFAAYALRPGPRYEPIGPHERGTFAESVNAFQRLGTDIPPTSTSVAPVDNPAPQPTPTSAATTGTVPASSVAPLASGSPTPTPTPTPTPSVTPTPTPTVTP